MAGESTAAWSELGAIPTDRLTETRLQLHWAAQPVMAVVELPADSREPAVSSFLRSAVDAATKLVPDAG